MKPRIYLPFLGLSLTLATSAIGATDREALKKELTVMESIFKTSLQESSKKAPIRILDISSTYLANQGVVFNVKTSRHHRGLLVDLNDIVAAIPEAPIPPITMALPSGDYEFSFGQEWEHFAEDTANQIEEAFRQTAEKLRELRYEERDASRGERELERERRDLQFQLRNAAEDSQEIKEELAAVEKALEKAKAKTKEVKAYAEKIESEQKQKKEEQKRAREEVYKQFLANFEAELGNTLCRFGSGLRALPKKESVTIVMNESHGKNQDRIYVFNQENIIKCVQTSINSETLLSEATIYEF